MIGDGCIVVTQGDEKVEFNNYKVEDVITYSLKRDPETKKFPLISIYFYFDGPMDMHLFGIIDIPSLNFLRWVGMNYRQNRYDIKKSKWDLILDLDVNTLNPQNDYVVINIDTR